MSQPLSESSQDKDEECKKPFQSPSKSKKYQKEDFVIVKALGQGAFGEVILVQKKDNQQQLFALKIVDKEFLAKERKQYQVYTERGLLSCLDHVGIIKLYFSFQDKQNLYFGLEFVEGGDFANYIKLNFKNLTNDTIKFYIAEIIIIIEYLHSKGIAHRDLKPENIIMTQHRHLKLIDFGTAKIFNPQFIPKETLKLIEETRKKYKKEDQQIQNNSQQDQQIQQPSRDRASTFVGTAEYVSPELLESDICNYQADLWAIGCIIYKMFTGKTPFYDSSEYLVFQNIKNVKYDLNLIQNNEARDLISKLLVKEPDLRLGAGLQGTSNDYQNLKNHPFFQNISWTAIFLQDAPVRQVYSPIKKNCSSQGVINDQPKFVFPDEQKEIDQSQEQQQSIAKNPNPQIVMQGICLKRVASILFVIPLYRPRFLELYDNPGLIIYYDPETKERKGQILLQSDVTIQLTDNEHFTINVPSKKKYYFKHAEHNAQEWVDSIKKVMLLNLGLNNNNTNQLLI